MMLEFLNLQIPFQTTIDILGLTEDHLSMSMYVSHDLGQDDMSSSLTEFG